MPQPPKFKFKVGDKFILRTRRGGDNYGIPLYEFDKVHEVLELKSPQSPWAWEGDRYGYGPVINKYAFASNSSMRGYWYVLEDMMETLGGPW